jgi:hypothetical protein
MSEHARWTIAGLIASGLVGGCVNQSLNHDLAMVDSPSGERVMLDTFQASPMVQSGAADAPAEAETVGSSLNGLSRDHWQETRVLVPTSGATHWALYKRDLDVSTSSPRGRGEFPTADTCLRTFDAGDTRAEFRHAVFSPFAAATDIVLFIPRAIVAPPWRQVLDRPTAYARSPRSEVIGSCDTGNDGAAMAETPSPASEAPAATEQE